MGKRKLLSGADAKTHRNEGLSFRKIGKRLGVDEGTVRKRMIK